MRIWLFILLGVLAATLLMEVTEGRSIIGCYARGIFAIDGGNCR